MTKLWAMLGIAVTALLGLFGLYTKGAQAGRDREKAKEAEARAKNLDDVKKAQDAAAAVRPDDGGMSVDPNNRDNWR